MYAVIETGGKQYRVEVGTELKVELLDVEPGSTMQLDRVLLVADGETAAIGRPVVANASVAATVVRRERGDKVVSFKYRPKARRRVKKGHRQELTVLRISDIVLDGHSAAAEVQQAEEARQRDRARLEEAARRQAAADAELAAKLAAEKPVADGDESKGRASSKAVSKDRPAKAGVEKAEAQTKPVAGPRSVAGAKSRAPQGAVVSARGGAGPAAKKAGASTKSPASPKASAEGGTPKDRTGRAEATGAKAPARPRTKKES